MEKLAGEFQSQISMIFERPLALRNLYLCEAHSIEDLHLVIQPNSQRFCLLLLMDAGLINADKVREAGAYLAELGMVYLCAWGPECENIEDLMDEGTRRFNETLGGNDVIMTTSHASESLEEALWYFVHSAFPTAGLTEDCTDWILGCVGESGWASEIRRIAHDTIYLPPKD
ncbi:MAG TPA: hypothetical protein VLX60_09725 [Terriglobales bacterium]|nr:hypothetical protein [Terriglobales bacterium]